MRKEEREFFDTDMIAWEPVPGAQPGIYEKILSRDPDTGSYTRLLKFAPGLETAETLTHDFWEEVYIVKGVLIDTGKNQVFTEGMYACRPPGMKHGPYKIPEGCITVEFRLFL
ncbi:MAG: cupin domain-containing protein [Chloroflexi bacterium]|nr:cupin domain-containing protein [Chloroflexota bacterium]